MPWIVDGYNFIFRDERLARMVDRRELSAARDALVERLAAYVRASDRQVTVVFDGGQAEEHFPQRQVRSGVRMLFADPSDTADTRILDAIKAHPPAADWRLVTSDRGLGRAAGKLGARVMSCEAFRHVLARALTGKGDAPPDGEPASKYGTLEAWEIEYWSGEFGIDSNVDG
jgi:predicted RNA-binding protein with PIN domain